MAPTFFATPEDFRAWLEKNHAEQQELWVGYYKKASGKPSITWSESVDQALCFGWIDGLRKSVDDESYKIRFTPRRPTSQWSKVNLQKVDALMAQGLMRPAGIKIYEQRRKDESGSYSYEQRQAAKLNADQEALFRANATAWKFFQSQPPTYRNTAIHWVISAKQEKTRQRRLGILIDDSAQELRIAQLRRKAT